MRHLPPLSVCALFAVASVHVAGTGVDIPRGGWGAFVGAGAGVGLDAPISSRWSVQIRGDVLGTIVPVRTMLAGTEVAKSSPASAVLGVGLGYSF